MIALIDEYKKELSGVACFADKTVQNYTSCILLYSEYAKKLGMDPIKSNGHHVQNWILQLKKSGLGPSRLQNHQCALKSFFALCVKMNLIPKNPADPLPVIRRVKSERNKPISKDIAYRLLRCIDQRSFLGMRNFLIISLFWALGLRLNELISLKVSDFEPGHDPKQKIGLLRIHGKNKKQRALFVVDKLYDHMIAYCAHPESPKKKSMPFFPSMKNRTISGDQVQRIIRIYAERANINERIRPHVLRHSFATEMYHQNVPLSAIQAMMGHSKMDETAVYIHIDQKLQRKALEHITITGRLSW
jgi:site-specific recombinase XerD